MFQVSCLKFLVQSTCDKAMKKLKVWKVLKVQKVSRGKVSERVALLSQILTNRYRANFCV